VKDRIGVISVTNTHLRLHNGQKPYACDVCSAKFTQYVHLRLHKRLHANERPYACMSCGKKYISRFKSNNANLVTLSFTRKQQCATINLRLSSESLTLSSMPITEVKYQEKVLGHHNEVTFDLTPFALAGYMALER
ncbi:unnamed protein product, partial [Strongylus vulgaris]